MPIRIPKSDIEMFDIAVQPPTQARPGVILFPPVVARVHSDPYRYGELSQIWAVATLVYRNGEVASEQLGGQTADSAHPMPQSLWDNGNGNGSSSQGCGANRDQGYFYFPDLVIYQPGRYRIRISLMRMAYTSESPEGIACVEENVDSHSIVVEGSAPRHARPSKGLTEFRQICSPC